jgi:ATP-dependent Clp protease ATP-binding subunit ClpA
LGGPLFSFSKLAVIRQFFFNQVRLNRAGLSNTKRPIASFFFLGPTGVGKTELCKAISKLMFETEHALIRIDMSEFMVGLSVVKMTFSYSLFFIGASFG